MEWEEGLLLLRLAPGFVVAEDDADPVVDDVY